MFRPIRDQILVKAEGGLTIRESILRETPVIATVVALGEGYYSGGTFVKLAVEKDAKIMFMPYSGKELELNNDKFVLLRESDILGIL